MALVALRTGLTLSTGAASAWAMDRLWGLAGVVFLMRVFRLAWLLVVAAEHMIGVR